jgi:hypothetical protein
MHEEVRYIMHAGVLVGHGHIRGANRYNYLKMLNEWEEGTDFHVASARAVASMATACMPCRTPFIHC